MLVKVQSKGVSQYVDELDVKTLSLLKDRGFDIVRDEKGVIRKYSSSVLKASENSAPKGTVKDIFG